MKGSEFVAVVNLSTRDGIVARAGERCDFVPVESLPWLLEAGSIVKATHGPQPSKKAKA